MSGRFFSGREGDFDTKAPRVAKERGGEKGCVKDEGRGEERR